MTEQEIILTEDDAIEVFAVEEEWDASNAVSDSVKLYLNQIRNIPLLSIDEEKALLDKIAAGDDKAKQKLIEHNLRLVVSIAKRYRGCGIPFLDLIQEGNMGLMTAASKYNIARGTRFSTCATWYVRQAISKALTDQSRTIRIPGHIADLLSKIKRVSANIVQLTGRNPTDEELATAIGVDTIKIRAALDMSQALTSLDTPIGEDEDTSFGDMIEDSYTENALDNLIQEANHNIIQTVFATLSDKEADVLQLRFGIGQLRPLTLEEVGEKFGVTRERIRQIETKAMRKMRHPARMKLLKEAMV